MAAAKGALCVLRSLCRSQAPLARWSLVAGSLTFAHSAEACACISPAPVQVDLIHPLLLSPPSVPNQPNLPSPLPVLRLRPSRQPRPRRLHCLFAPLVLAAAESRHLNSLALVQAPSVPAISRSSLQRPLRALLHASPSTQQHHHPLLLRFRVNLPLSFSRSLSALFNKYQPILIAACRRPGPAAVTPS